MAMFFMVAAVLILAHTALGAEPAAGSPALPAATGFVNDYAEEPGRPGGAEG